MKLKLFMSLSLVFLAKTFIYTEYIQSSFINLIQARHYPHQTTASVYLIIVIHVLILLTR